MAQKDDFVRYGKHRISRAYISRSIIPRIARWTRKDEKSGCLLWIGELSAAGYARMQICGEDGYFLANVHRLILIIVGVDVVDLHVDHVCQNKPCVEPMHLEAVSHGENVRRGDHHLRGKRMLEKTRLLLSVARRENFRLLGFGNRKGSKMSEEQKRKISAAQTGRTDSAEVRKRKSLAALKRWQEKRASV